MLFYCCRAFAYNYKMQIIWVIIFFNTHLYMVMHFNKLIYYIFFNFCCRFKTWLLSKSGLMRISGIAYYQYRNNLKASQKYILLIICMEYIVLLWGWNGRNNLGMKIYLLPLIKTAYRYCSIMVRYRACRT